MIRREANDLERGTPDLEMVVMPEEQGTCDGEVLVVHKTVLLGESTSGPRLPAFCLLQPLGELRLSIVLPPRGGAALRSAQHAGPLSDEAR